MSSERISFEEIYMKLAFDLSKRSTCSRLNVGAVIVSEDFSRVFGIGYNGNAAGLGNHCDNDIPGNCGCLHAEDNALLKTNGVPEVLKLVLTYQPCSYCAKRRVNKGGIKRSLLLPPYRLKEGVEILQNTGISEESIPPPAETFLSRSRGDFFYFFIWFYFRVCVFSFNPSLKLFFLFIPTSRTMLKTSSKVLTGINSILSRYS